MQPAIWMGSIRGLFIEGESFSFPLPCFLLALKTHHFTSTSQMGHTLYTLLEITMEILSVVGGHRSASVSTPGFKWLCSSGPFPLEQT